MPTPPRRKLKGQADTTGEAHLDLAALRPGDFHIVRSPGLGPVFFHSTTLYTATVTPRLGDWLQALEERADEEVPSVPREIGADLADLLARVKSQPPAAGADQPAHPQATWDPGDYPWANLTLLVTDRCNLRCHYCFEGYTARRPGRDITRETAAAALDCFFDVLFPHAEVYDLHLFGGEPLLAWEMVTWITHEAERRARTKQRPLYLSISTNAVGLTGEHVHFLREHDFDVSVSLDGPPDVHARFRPLVGGRGSFGAVQAGLGHLLAGRPPYSSLCGRLHRGNQDAYRWFLAAYQAARGGHGVSLEPARLSPAHPLALGEEDIPAILRSYRSLADQVAARLLAGDDTYLGTLLQGNDYLARFAMRLVAREALQRRCGAGADDFIVATDGRLYACEALVGREGLELGDIRHGLMPDRHQPWLALDLGGRASCRSCWARYLCGGGCYACSLLAGKDLGSPEPLDCRYTRGLAELALEMYARLEAQSPGLLAAALARALARLPDKHRVFIPEKLAPRD